MRCYVYDNQKDWDAYASAITYVFNDQVYRSKNTRPFDLMFSRRIPDLTLESTVSTGKKLTSAEQRIGFVATLQYVLDRTCTYFNCTLERCKGFQPASWQRSIEDNDCWICAHWCVGRCHQNTEARTCSERSSLSVGARPTFRGHPATGAGQKEYSWHGCTRPSSNCRDPDTASFSFSNESLEKVFEKSALIVLWDLESLFLRWLSTWVSIELRLKFWDYMGASQQYAGRSDS